MKNKVELKKALVKSAFVIIFTLILFGVYELYAYKTYTRNFNSKVASIITNIIEKYPDIDKNRLIEEINSEADINADIFRNYGIDIEEEAIIIKNDKCFEIFLIISLVMLFAFSITLLVIFLRYNSNKDKELKEITRYIEDINNKNYRLDISDNTEDELSILKNEVYKTTIMLKESAENSIKDKVNLKDSLSDISHQLKTPLAGITVMIDDILENPDMDENTRNDFIKNIKRQIVNINFLINSLLKLSKLDVNAIDFINREETLKNLINKSVEKVSILCELKGIKINVYGNSENKIYCDAKWQIEAITNILKNAIEHSNQKSSIDVYFEQSKMYSKIVIKDYGVGIAKEDLPHIFERFYKGKNSSSDSIGIGLALAKSIIEKNNGSIDVVSEENKGTQFIIKYFV